MNVRWTEETVKHSMPHWVLVNSPFTQLIYTRQIDYKFNALYSNEVLTMCVCSRKNVGLIVAS